MLDEKSEIASTIDAVSKLTENIPIYQDLVQPAAKELGKNLATVTKLITVALSPVRGLVWGFNQIEEYLTETLAEKLKKTPPENILPPPTLIAGPVFESLRFCSDEEGLRDMFSNLLANSMDSKSKHLAHPAFVEIIKNLSPDEANILKYLSHYNSHSAFPIIDQAAHFSSSNGQTVIFRNVSLIGNSAGCDFPLLASSYLDNLIRLGILYVREGVLLKSGTYDEIENSSYYINNISIIEDMNNRLPDKVTHVPIKNSITATDFGNILINICVKEKSAEMAQ